MKDTAPEAEELMRKHLRALRPADRIRMATGMFSAARSLVRAGARRKAEPTVEDRELMLVRLYSRDLSAEALQGVRNRLTPRANDASE